MTNPFERDDLSYLVLINDEGQYSIWPSFADIPNGWSMVRNADSRQAALNYVESHWTDMRPKRLIARADN
jgi:MbtH protein